MYVHAAASIIPALSFPHYAPKSVLYVCVPIPSLQIGSSVPCFLDSVICVNIQYLFFSQKSILFTSCHQFITEDASQERPHEGGV